jgi:hypothetical protein
MIWQTNGARTRSWLKTNPRDNLPCRNCSVPSCRSSQLTWIPIRLRALGLPHQKRNRERFGSYVTLHGQDRIWTSSATSRSRSSTTRATARTQFLNWIQEPSLGPMAIYKAENQRVRLDKIRRGEPILYLIPGMPGSAVYVCAYEGCGKELTVSWFEVLQPRACVVIVQSGLLLSLTK